MRLAGLCALGLLGLGLSAQTAGAQEWRVISQTDEGAVAFDLDIGDVFGAGLRLAGRFAEFQARPAPPVDYSVSRYEFDCEAKTFVLTSQIWFGADDAVLRSTDERSEGAAAPGSAVESMMYAICRGDQGLTRIGYDTPREAVDAYRADLKDKAQ